MELKRLAGPHCHGPGAVAPEDRGDKQMAKKKLYIASAVCLVFMIGEVIGKSRTSVLRSTCPRCEPFRYLLKNTAGAERLWRR